MPVSYSILEEIHHFHNPVKAYISGSNTGFSYFDFCMPLTPKGLPKGLLRT